MRAIFIAFVICLGATACDQAPHGPAPRNVLLITLDTTRADYIGCYGSDGALTPAIDGLASEGVRFANHVATSQTTNPSHASILTGLYPSQHRVMDNSSPLSDAAVSVAEVLRDHDFVTLAAVSAKHLNPSNAAFDQGFYQFLECAGTQMTAAERNEKFLPELETLTGQTPFFAWVHYFDPHWPYTPPVEFEALHERGDDFDPIPHPHTNAENPEDVDPDEYIQKYRAEISYLDSEIARVLELLERAGVRDETLIVLVADHGESLMEKEIHFGHAGLYNQVTHVPMIVSASTRTPKGKVYADLTSSTDIMPTILDLLEIESELPTLGVSLRGAWENPDTELHDYVYSEAYKGVIRAIYDGEFKYIQPFPKDWSMPVHRLYRDPRVDYWEEDDLVEEDADRTRELADLLARFIDESEATALPEVLDHEVDPETEEALRALGYVGGR